jgi:hypothetical protein
MHNTGGGGRHGRKVLRNVSTGGHQRQSLQFACINYIENLPRQ